MMTTNLINGFNEISKKLNSTTIASSALLEILSRDGLRSFSRHLSFLTSNPCQDFIVLGDKLASALYPDLGVAKGKGTKHHSAIIAIVAPILEPYFLNYTKFFMDKSKSLLESLKTLLSLYYDRVQSSDFAFGDFGMYGWSDARTAPVAELWKSVNRATADMMVEVACGESILIILHSVIAMDKDSQKERKFHKGSSSFCLLHLQFFF